MLHIVEPLAFVSIPVFIGVLTTSSFIIGENSIEGISVEQFESTLSFIVVLPVSSIHASFGEFVDSSPVFLSLNEISLINIFIDVFEDSFSVREVISVFTRMDASISIQGSAFSLLQIPDKLALIDVPTDSYNSALAIFHTSFPLALILFLFGWIFVEPDSILEVVGPATRIVGPRCIEIVSWAIFEPVPQLPLIPLA
jgi:hypothetical protein